MRGTAESPAKVSRHPTRLFAIVAAIEAVVIVVLLLSRQPADGVDTTRREPTSVSVGAQEAAAPRRVTSVTAPEPARVGYPMPPAGAPAPLAVPLPEKAPLGVVVAGSVTRVDGGSTDRELVRAIPDGSTDEADERTARIEDGIFALVGLGPGAWRLSCQADGTLEQTIDLVLDAGRPLERVEFVLERAPRVAVRFRTPNGRPLHEAMRDEQVSGELNAVVTAEPLPLQLEDDVTRVGYTTRTFELSDPDPAEWDRMLVMRVPLPVHVSAVWHDRVYESLLVASESPGVTFTLPVEVFMGDLASLRVRVVDEQSGDAVVGALVSVAGRHEEVDTSGVAVFERMPPKSYELDIHAAESWTLTPGGGLMLSGRRSEAEHAGETIPVTLHAGERLDLGNIALQRTILVRGRVVDEAGEPVVIWVEASQLDAPPASWVNERKRATETDPSDGSFAMRVPPGRWAFTAAEESRAAPAVLRVVEAPIDDLQLVTRPALAVRMDFTRTGERSSWHLVIEDRNGLECAETYFDWGDPTPWTTALIPGDYRVVVLLPEDELPEERTLSSVPFQLGETSLRLAVTLP